MDPLASGPASPPLPSAAHAGPARLQRAAAAAKIDTRHRHEAVGPGRGCACVWQQLRRECARRRLRARLPRPASCEPGDPSPHPRSSWRALPRGHVGGRGQAQRSRGGGAAPGRAVGGGPARGRCEGGSLSPGAAFCPSPPLAPSTCRLRRLSLVLVSPAVSAPPLPRARPGRTNALEAASCIGSPSRCC